MSTRFAEDFSTPPLPETDLAEAARRFWKWLAPPTKPDASTVESEYLDDSDAATNLPKSAKWILPEDAGLSTLLSDLAELFQRDDYDEDFVRPTVHALKTTWGLLATAGTKLGSGIPLGTIYPYGNGGLRIEWIGQEKELRLSISPTAGGQSYIYYEVGDRYDADYNVSASNLANWLRWFNRNGRGAR